MTTWLPMVRCRRWAVDRRSRTLATAGNCPAARKALLGDKAFGHVYRQLRKQWFNEILDCPHASVRQDELAARLRALDLIPVALGNLLDNYRVDAQKAARNG